LPFETKGLDLLKKELEECGESLIDPVYGHGSQTLTNLMLCGLATANVFDDEKYLEGLKLQGIPKQSSIGFLTIMEYLRYCEVNSILFLCHFNFENYSNYLKLRSDGITKTQSTQYGYWRPKLI
jgi:hypothetical protein